MDNQSLTFFADFMPHGHCYGWVPSILWTSVIADGITTAAYFSIPIALIIYIKKKSKLTFGYLALLFATFILFCGITHAFSVYTIWHGSYGLLAIFKSLTAISSFITALIIFKKLPQALEMPTLAEYQKTLAQSQDERIELIRLQAVAEQQALVQQQLDRLQRITESIDDGTWELNTYTSALWLNRKMAKLLNLDKHHVTLADWLDSVHPQDLPKVTAALLQRSETDPQLDVLYRGRSSEDPQTYQWRHLRGSQVLNAEQTQSTLIAGLLSDVDTEINKDLELQEKTRFLNSLLNAVVTAVYIFNPYRKEFSYINTEFTTLTGYDLQSINALMSSESSVNFLHTTDTPKVIAARKVALKSNTLSDLKFRIQHREGQWVWCHGREIAFRKQSHETEFLGSFVDITQIEQQRIALIESNQSLERFAYAASHDLQEPLRKICSFSKRLQTRHQNSCLDEETMYELDRIHCAAENMSTMIKSLLSLSRFNSISLNTSWVPLSTVITRVLDILALAIEQEQAQINLINDCLCLIDPTAFQLVLQNLIQNALDHCPEDRNPVVTIGADIEQGAIIVSDNGTGIDADKQEKVFLPFERGSKGRRNGHGIGLALCRQIVKAHQGSICVIHSETGQGTTLKIALTHDCIKTIT